LFQVALVCSVAGGWPVYGVAVNSGIDVGGDWCTEFLRQMPEQSRRPREQRHTAQQFGWQTYIGKRRTSHPCTIKRERAVKYLGMHSANRFEEPQMWSAQPLMLGDGYDYRSARVTGLVNRMTQPRDIPASRAFHRDRPSCQRVPLLISRWQVTLDRCQDGGKKAPGILCHTEKARASSQQSRSYGSLQSIGCTVECQAGGECGGSEAVVGERNEDRLEDTYLLWRRSPLRGQPERKFAESYLAKQIVCQIMTEELYTVR
jgi:hypothetical protein